MQWPYDITADQWSAAGAFWGGMAQLGLVVVGAAASWEWRRRERFRGVQEIMEIQQQEYTKLLQSCRSLMVIPEHRGTANGILHANVAQSLFDGILINMHICMTRMYFYDNALSDEIQKVNAVFEIYRAKYLQYRKLSLKPVDNTSQEASAKFDDEIRNIENELFSPDSALLNAIIQQQLSLLQRAKKLLWRKA